METNYYHPRDLEEAAALLEVQEGAVYKEYEYNHG